MSVFTSNKNPIVTIFDVAVSTTRESSVGTIRSGLIGSMNLSTASELYGFELVPFLGEEIVALDGERLCVSDKQWAKSGTGVYVEYNKKGTEFHIAEQEAHPETIQYDELGQLIEQ